MTVSPTEKSVTGTQGIGERGVRGEQTWMLVKVITYGALIILLDELENDGTVIERFFVQNLISDAVSIEFRPCSAEPLWKLARQLEISENPP